MHATTEFFKLLPTDPMTCIYLEGFSLPLKNSYFISHKNGQEATADTFLEEFHEALQRECKMLCSYDCYVDLERLKPGHAYNEKLAQELCQSACLIVIFTPRYFDTQATYCAREYKAMEQLESQRLKSNPRLDPTNGLIIPVVLRGFEDLPQEIAGRRQVANFDSFLPGRRRMTVNQRYASHIKSIADYIFRRCQELETVPEAFNECEEAALPSEEDVMPWLTRVTSSPLPLPSRVST